MIVKTADVLRLWRLREQRIVTISQSIHGLVVASGPPSMRAATLLLVAGVALAGDTPTLAGGVALAGDTPTLPPPRSEHGAALLWRLHSLCGGLGIALNTFVLWMFVRKGNVS